MPSAVFLLYSPIKLSLHHPIPKSTKLHVPEKAQYDTINIWTTHFLKLTGAEVDPQTNNCTHSLLLAGQHVYDEKQ